MENWLEILTYLGIAAFYFISQMLRNKGKRPEVDEEAGEEARRRPVNTSEEPESEEHPSYEPERKPLGRREVSSPDEPAPQETSRPKTPFETWMKDLQQEWEQDYSTEKKAEEKPSTSPYRQEQQAKEVKSDEGKYKGFDWGGKTDEERATHRKEASARRDEERSQEQKADDFRRAEDYRLKDKEAPARKYARLLKQKEGLKQAVVMNEILNPKHF